MVDVRQSWFSQSFSTLLKAKRLFDAHIVLTKIFVSQKIDFVRHKRGESVPLILSRSEELSGRKPEYRLIDDSELL